MAAAVRFCAGRVWKNRAAVAAISLLPLAMPQTASACSLSEHPAAAGPASIMAPAHVQDAAGEPAGRAVGEREPAGAEPSRFRYKMGLEAKVNFRVSPNNKFPVPFPFAPNQLPVGQSHAFEETVDPGRHLEASNLTLLLDGGWSDSIKAHSKIDFLNLYYRNPTSTDQKYEITELWFRVGQESLPATVTPRAGVYLKIGKFAKFERQDDRHLESYGVVSTAFNRFEDIGAELGTDIGHIYAKVSGTAGNPVFLRDPNALAGDNGTPALLRLHPDPPLHTGIDILYDSHVNKLNFNHPQIGAAIGTRFGDDSGSRGLDVQVWARRRTLAPTVDFHGTFYRGDLRVLMGPPGFLILPISDELKREAGANLWLYLDAFSLFGQFVDQRLAGLPRRGYEAEAAYRFELPLWLAAGGHQLLSSIAPAVRFSRLSNGFHNLLPTPAPSFAWPWDKIDAGVRIVLFAGIDLSAEYADNTFTLGSGAKRHDNEFLSTLRLRV